MPLKWKEIRLTMKQSNTWFPEIPRLNRVTATTRNISGETTPTTYRRSEILLDERNPLQRIDKERMISTTRPNCELRRVVIFNQHIIRRNI